MLEKQIIINATSSETRVAVVEGEQVAEIIVERHRERGLVGNIYNGTISRVLPGMQSAFIDIGSERAAFLYGGDVLDPANIRKRNDEFSESQEDDPPPHRRSETPPIESILKEGQTISVQVSKDPLGTKGARVTMFLSIPGRYLVLMPELSHIGVSRRIQDQSERDRLRTLIQEVKPEGVGVIVRTAAEGASSQHIQKDLRYLLKVWKTVANRRRREKPKTLIYSELDLILKTTRDLYSAEVKKIVIDDSKAHEQLKQFLSASIPGASQKLELYEHPSPIFDEYGIEMDIARSLSTKVWLKSGGYLIIDQTEALTSFDVNTGKFVGQLRVQDTILRTNLEAIYEIVAQLRLRNIGGIIVIDLIDMERPEDREQVFEVLLEELKADKAKTNVLKVSELGLIQMTRKRTRDSLERILTEPCPFCSGRGRVYSTTTEAYNLLRDIERFTVRTGVKDIQVKIREDIKDWVLEEEKEFFKKIVCKHKLNIQFILSEVSPQLLQEPPYEVLS